MKKTLTIFLFLIVFVENSFSMSGSESLKTQYILLLKILTYNKKFLSRSSDNVVIGIAYQSGYRLSSDTKESLVDIIDESALRVEKRKVNYILIDMSEAGAMENFVRNNTPDVIFILPLRGFNISSITSYSRKYKIMTFTDVPAYMDEGVSTCVNMDGEKPGIMINRISARSEGVDFSSQLLKVARMVE